MSVLGDKIAANILAQTAKVPSIPWSGDGLEAVLTDVSFFCFPVLLTAGELGVDGLK